MNPIYLDYNATTPIDKEVAETMKPFLDMYFGNPSSAHSYGVTTKLAVIKARNQIAELIGCSSDEIVFTSGGTESNNFALKGVAFANRNKGKHIITSAIEHPAILEVCRYLEGEGFEITYLPVDKFGMVSIGDVEKAIRQETILISIMHANNEVGTIQPIAEIGKIAKKHGIIFHSDAAQSLGKISVNVKEMHVDLLSIAGHKLYAPKGIGALYIRHGIKLQKLIHGADHEMNLRAGTENVLEIAGLGKACEIALRDLKKNSIQLKAHRDQLHDLLALRLKNVRLNGHPDKRLPNTLSLGFYKVEANTLLSELTNIAASAGAACHTDSIDISEVLQAMQVPEEYAMGTIRFSTGKHTTSEEIEQAAEAIVAAVERLSNTSENVQTHSDKIENIRLTQFTHGLGCACKIRPQYLEKILSDFPKPTDPKVLVGIEASDDAAVYLISKEIALIQTVDFFTPIVDDPYLFGAIAAANSLSDIYAMGGRPIFALNIVGFPENRLPMEVLKQILKGAQDKATEAGISILGGHTIEDNEPKFGMAVSGLVHPDKILKNSGAKPGDIIVLTKPLGTGIIATAAKRGLADEDTRKQAYKVMAALNKTAAEIISNYPVTSCTDVTGFGFLGHLREMSRASGMDFEVRSHKVPALIQAEQLAANNVIPGGTINNMDYVKSDVTYFEALPYSRKVLLNDAQTSGGLLFTIPEKYATSLMNDFTTYNMSEVAVVGRVKETGSGKIFVAE